MSDSRYPLSSLKRKRQIRANPKYADFQCDVVPLVEDGVAPDDENYVIGVISENVMEKDPLNNSVDSDCDSIPLICATDDSEADTHFQQALANWASEGLCKRKVNEILSLLREHKCFQYLPSDSRTLLETLRSIDVQNGDGGSSSSHLGLEKELKSFIKKEMEDVKRDIRSQMKQLKEEMREAIGTLAIQMRSTPQNLESQTNGMQLLHNLPMKSMMEMDDFEEAISTSGDYQQFLVQYFRERSSTLFYRSLTVKLFSTALNKTVYDICALLMSNEMAMTFCMKGRTPHKISFEQRFPRIIELIFDTVKSKGAIASQLDILTVKKSIGEWLRLARLRGGHAKPTEATERSLLVDRGAQSY